MQGMRSGQQKTVKIEWVPSPKATSPFLGFGAEWDSRNYRAAGITESDFELIRRRVTWMRMPVVRLMMQLRWCCRAGGAFDFDTPEMQDLYRHLDVCEAIGAAAFLTDWGIMGDWLRVPDIGTVDDPRYAEAVGAYLEHLVRGRGYRCLRYFIMGNEPNCEVKDFALWRRGVEQVARELRRRGLDRQIGIAGTDQVNSPEYDWHYRAVDEVPAVFAAYDIHRYAGDGEIFTGWTGRQIQKAWDYVRAKDPDGARKPCIVGEAGLNDGAVHPHGQSRIGTFEYGLFMADYAVQAVLAGSTAVLAWMLDDNSHDGFTWGLWSSKADGLRLRPWFYPWSLLCREFRPGSAVHAAAAEIEGVRLLAADADGRRTVCVVNHGPESHDLEWDCGIRTGPVAVYRYAEDHAPVDEAGFPVPSRMQDVTGGALALACPSRTVTIVVAEGGVYQGAQ